MWRACTTWTLRAAAIARALSASTRVRSRRTGERLAERPGLSVSSTAACAVVNDKRCALRFVFSTARFSVSSSISSYSVVLFLEFVEALDVGRVSEPLQERFEGGDVVLDLFAGFTASWAASFEVSSVSAITARFAASAAISNCTRMSAPSRRASN